MHFRESLQRRQKQHTLDKFLVRKAKKTIAGGEESTASKRQKREKNPKGKLPSLVMEGNSSNKGI